MMHRVTGGLALTCALAALLPSSAAAARPALLTGFTDLGSMQNDPSERSIALQHVKAAGGSIVRLMWRWRDVEVQRPPDATSAQDPAFAGYNWSKLDAAMRDIRAAGLDVLVMVYVAPPWWEGPGRPPVSQDAPEGTWRPDPAAYARFMTAAARRYSGTYPDPKRLGEVLPRVRSWQIWNEPNLPDYLAPQWRRTGKRLTDVSPGVYRRLLDAAYDAIKAVVPSDQVVTAGTAPYGEPWPGGRRMPPALFVRKLLCVDGRAHPRAQNCRATPAKFDVLAHHPYPIGPPGRHAINPDDVVVPDLAKLTRPLAVALKAGNVLPRRPKQLWATEISWDSSPPDPGGLPLDRQARYLAGALYVLWRQGVDTVLWWNLRDDAKGAGYQYSLQSGVYFRGNTVAQDTPKPSLQAMRFPFVVYRRYANFRGHGTAKVWGIAPHAGVVQLQRRAASGWKTFATLRADSSRTFLGRLRVSRGAFLRALQGSEISISASVF